jgi:hypothetical protein
MACMGIAVAFVLRLKNIRNEIFYKESNNKGRQFYLNIRVFWEK